MTFTKSLIIAGVGLAGVYVAPLLYRAGGGDWAIAASAVGMATHFVGLYFIVKAVLRETRK